MSLSEFINMGGHGFYVWTSYGLGLFFFVTLYVSTRVRNKKLIKQLQRINRQQQRESNQG
ncbi:MAG: heme exporter protein CcmD [Gammaproteobacteria bacterium]|nr:heme exporter protein CcmD [Gammaproteobacteria bacterium]NNJ73411.1 heme exporter protein CcmD [Enterobacterales bacterium]